MFIYHWLVIERESLHTSESYRSTGDFLEYDKSLTPHFQGFHGDYVQDLTKLREDRIEGLLELIFLDLFIEVIYVDRVVWSNVHHSCKMKFLGYVASVVLFL